MIEKLKKIKINEINQMLEIYSKLDALNKEQSKLFSLKPYKSFNFFQKYFFKRKEYKEYLVEMEKANEEIEEKRKKMDEERKKLERQKIAGVLKCDLIEQLNIIKAASTLEEMGILKIEDAIRILDDNGVAPEDYFGSYEEAKMLPEYMGYNLEYMKRAIQEDIEFIKYDKTNEEELYRRVILAELKRLEETGDKSDNSVQYDINAYREFLLELDNPKKVEEGKYKLPHKYMFEEIRKKAFNNETRFTYHIIDGKYPIEFAEELEEIYSSPKYIIGMHGTDINIGKDKKIKSIFEKGLRNSALNDWYNNANGTVLYGEKLCFTDVLYYKMPGRGNPSLSIILKLPAKAFDKDNPIPIWGSNESMSNDNYNLQRVNKESYILPEYVYGAYLKDDYNLIHNENNKEKYKYLVYDRASGKSGEYIEVDEKDTELE